MTDAENTRPSPLLTELALALVATVAVSGFLRLFADRTAVLPLLAAALGTHLIGAVGRRLGWGMARTAAATGVAVAALVLYGLYPHTAAFVLPTGETFSLIASDLREAWEIFGDVEAPAPRSRGFLLTASVILAVAFALSDWAAFRLRAIVEALLPPASVFVFTTLLGRGPGAVAHAAAMAGAVFIFTAAQRARRTATEDAWVGDPRGVRPVAMIGVAIAVAASLLAAVAGPRLPTADQEAMIDWRGDDGPKGRTTVSPLVDIRSRLVEQSNTTVFTVESPRPAYWRLTALPVFDGQVWTSNESFQDAGRDLPVEDPPDAATADLVQSFSIRRMGTIWAPGALTPVSVDETDADLRWSKRLNTLIVNRDLPTSDGIEYTITSRVPSFTPADLAAPLPADLSQLPEDLRLALELPPDLPPVVAESALDAVAGAGPSPYERARALQDWFRSEFDYDLEGVGPGHDGTAIEAFLSARRGYCEQFAGTYAAMARTLGIPARVAVGFTEGERTPDGTGFVVRGRNAHAWPEVWIPEAGWVPFEPTPSRGQPGTEAYTGVPPQQGDEPVVTTPTSTEARPSTTAAPGGAATTAPRPPEQTASAPAVDDSPSEGLPWWGWVLVAGSALIGLLALDIGAIAAVRSRRRARRRGTDDVGDRVRTAWWRAVDSLATIGLVPAASETAREFAQRAGPGLGDKADDLRRLAALFTGTTWSRPGAGLRPEVVERAESFATNVSETVSTSQSRADRIRYLIDPRTLVEPK